MRITIFLSSFLILLAVIGFAACDDNLGTVGQSIRPGSDNVKLGVDTVILSAKSVSFKDSVYARSSGGLLGEYTDDIFGKISSDYLSEFYCPKDMSFLKSAFSVDSVEFSLVSYGFIGDSTKLLGISAYEIDEPLNNPASEEYYFTNINPKDFCDMSKPLAHATIVYKDILNMGSSYPGYLKMIKAKSDTMLGHRFIDEWKLRPETFDNSTSLKKFFPGVYITTTYGTGALISISSTSMSIYYKYMGRNWDDSKDSVRTSIFQLHATSEVLQMNHIENQFPASIQAELDKEKSDLTYLKSPAGIYTEITIPMGPILDSMKTYNMINSASFYIKGNKEEELKSKLKQPYTLLFVNKDSIQDFFVNRRLENSRSSFLMNRDTLNNIYVFSTVGNNISQLIDHYVEKYKDAPNANDIELKYLVIPVDREVDLMGNYYVTKSINNAMSPTSAVLRTDEKNLKMSLVYSKYRDKIR